METLNWHSNKSAVVTAINSTFVDANVKNTSAKFQLYPTFKIFLTYPTYSVLNISPNFNIIIAMATDQI